VKVEDDLRDFILTELYFAGSASELTDDLHLIDSGIIDSMGILELVTHLEKRYGIEIPDEEMVVENFDSIEHIAALVESKRNAR
jgi:acyl carrier protein